MYFDAALFGGLVHAVYYTWCMLHTAINRWRAYSTGPIIRDGCSVLAEMAEMAQATYECRLFISEACVPH